jgi:hypothetical protein
MSSPRRLVVIALVVAVALGGCDFPPDPDQLEKTMTPCLRSAGLEVKTEIPGGGGRGHTAPEWELKIYGPVPAYYEEGARAQIAYADLYEDKYSAETDAPDWAERHGPVVLGIFIDDAPAAGGIRACVDKAIKQPRD